MELSINLWAVLIGIGAMQGFVLALFLIVKWKGYQGPNLWFGLIIGIFSYCLLEFTLLLSGHIKTFVHIFSFYAPLLFLLGPFLFLFAKTNLDQGYRFKSKALLHLIPSLVLIAGFIPFYLISSNEKIEILNSLYARGNELPPNLVIVNIVFFVQLSIYIVLAKREVAKNQKSTSVYRKIKSRVNNLIALLLTFYVITLTSFAIHTFSFQWRLQLLYAFMLSFSILMYWLSYRVLFSKNGKEYSSVPYHGKKSLPSDQHLPQLKHLLYEEKNFLDPDLSLKSLSKLMDLNSHQLSQLINQSYGTSFPILINELRIEEAKILLQANHEKKLLAVALESGFSNQTNFIRVFKQFTGQTPSQFRGEHKN